MSKFDELKYYIHEIDRVIEEMFFQGRLDLVELLEREIEICSKEIEIIKAHNGEISFCSEIIDELDDKLCDLQDLYYAECCKPY